MNTKSKTKPAPAAPTVRGEKRRNAILSALRDCVAKKGYAKTTLADVARAAEMSPSHLLYYYRGKDAILEHYFESVYERFLERMDTFRGEPVECQIDLLTHLAFAGHELTRSNMGFMLECFGLAVNDAVLRRAKADMDKRAKQYLTELFERTPRGAVVDPKESAEIAYALLVGLRTAVYFDEHPSLSEAFHLFQSSMLDLAGYDQQDPVSSRVAHHTPAGTHVPKRG
jgi:AcrR family transcriptional regulator